MKKELKEQIIEQLAAQLEATPDFYVTDIEGLNAEQTSALRRACFEHGIKLMVVKNTLLEKVLDKGTDEQKSLCQTLKGSTALMFSDVVNAPAKLIKEMQSTLGKPELKGAYLQECAYIGAENLETLINIKSREELIGDIIGLLQSPMKNVISALQNAGGQTIAGIVKTLSEK
ncbi:MAG: 50S ribosomal protein L10 [Bacteroidales bacterium]|jgi:large subunit ribosomal protein L10|nr:50S ribosomal protein L10 [Bacteroidales bacterium]